MIEEKINIRKVVYMKKLFYLLTMASLFLLFLLSAQFNNNLIAGGGGCGYMGDFSHRHCELWGGVWQCVSPWPDPCSQQ